MNTRRDISFSAIVQEAYNYWKNSLFYAILFSLIFFTFFFILTYFVFNYYGIYDRITEISPYLRTDLNLFLTKYIEIFHSENFQYAGVWMIAISAILFPLNIGMLNLYGKMSRGEPLTLGSFFIGYEGSNFFRYFGYGIFWNGIYFVCKPFLILGPIWVLLTLLVAPLMFFSGFSLSKALQISGRIFTKNILVCIQIMIVATLISYCGFFVCGVGVFMTFPFWNAMVYAFYKNIIYTTEKQNV